MDDDNVKTGFYENNKLLVWILIILIMFLVIYFLIKKNDTHEPDNVDKKIEISIKPTETKEISIGNSLKLTAEVSDYPDAQIVWSSENDKIATVDNNGNVTAVNYGKVAIVASFYDKDKTSYKATKDIIVADGDKNIKLEKVEFPEGDLYMPVNSTYKLSLLLTPSNAHIENKVFTVGDGLGDDKVAKVDNNGNVTSLSEGHTRVIVDINNGSFKRAIDVYVNNEYKKSNIVLSPTLLSFNSDEIRIKVGKSEKLSLKVNPSNVNQSYFNWISSDESIVSVSNNGEIKAHKNGNAIVSVSSINGKRDDIVVHVESDIVEVNDISLSIDSINMEVGQKQDITPIVSPSNASNKALSFIPYDSSIISVVGNSDSTKATISALKTGSTTLIIRANNNIEKRITINVLKDSSGKEKVDDGEEENEESVNYPTTIKVRSDRDNLYKTYDEALNNPVPGVSTVTVNLRVGVGKIKYCIQSYESKVNCTPNIEMYSNNSFQVPSGGIYVIRIKKYDYRGNEISSSSSNYINGVIHYYINTSGSLENESGYSVTGVYGNVVDAMNNPVSNGNVNIKVSGSSIKYCYTKEVSCDPVKVVTNTDSININDEGLWRIIVNQYDQNGFIVGTAGVWYLSVSSSSSVYEEEKKVATIPTASKYCRNASSTGGNVILTNPAGEGYVFSNNIQIVPDTYTILANLRDGYIWSDGTSGIKAFNCTLNSQ